MSFHLYPRRSIQASSTLYRTITRYATTMSSSTSPTIANRVIVLAGATSAGKSAAAMELVKLVDGEIVIADSVQVYRGLDIGSNKPTLADTTIVPHHLLDLYEPSTTVTAGDFCRQAATTIKDILRRGKVPIIVGGSTMWIQWLVHGIPDAPKASEEAVQQAKELLDPLESQGKWEEGLDILRQHAPERVEKLFANDWYRLRRALVVALDHTTPLHGQREPLLQEEDIRCFFLIEDRMQLYHTIDQRCRQLLERGLLEEVTQLLLTESLLPEHPVSKSIGYRQAIAYLTQPNVLCGDHSAFQQFVSDFGSATRNYARKQHNWYRKDRDFLFLKMTRPALLEAVKNDVRAKALKTKTLSQNKKIGPVPIPRQDEVHLPYVQIAEEILHWYSVPREEYVTALDRQLQAHDYHHRWTVQYHIPSNYASENELEDDVIKIIYERKGRPRPATHQPFNSTDKSMTSSKWTATDAGIRLPPLPEKQKFFTSTFNAVSGLPHEFDGLLDRADQCREKLWSEKPELMRAIHKELEKTSGKNDEVL
eukprot:gene2375-2607_t